MKVIIFILVLSILMPPSAVAQRRRRSRRVRTIPIETPNIGSISGKISSRSGVSLPGAIITVLQLSGINRTGDPTQLLADNNGDYVVPGLSPGSYKVTATASGFRSSSKTVEVIARQSTRLNFILRQ